MSDMNLTIKKIMTNLEEKIKDEETLNIVKTEIFNLYNAFADEISELNSDMNTRMIELAQSQNEANEKMDKIEKSLKKIENDIYLDDDDEEGEYTMEIVCPYCNKEFSLDIDQIADKEEINCPECKNAIELDWGHDCSCGECEDDCDCCGGDCHKDEDDNL
jgi:DNA-directed RNA polymerase subunit RPC12/RpoP